MKPITIQSHPEAFAGTAGLAFELVAYVAGPYRADTDAEVEANIQEAKATAIALWQMGLTVYCPHLNTAHFGGLCPESWFLAGHLVMLGRCDLLVLHPLWKESDGSKAEVQAAHKAQIPIFEWPRHAPLLSMFAAGGRLPSAGGLAFLRGILADMARDKGPRS
jgi:hypothetical protein